MKILLPLLLAASSLVAANVPSSPDLGKADGKCRAGESRPSFLVSPVGLKDRKGKFKLEVYPSNDKDFLADDNVLLNAGKTFRRVEVAVPASGAIELCVRVPAAGAYSVSLLHDRDSNRKFGWTIDGIGFSGNPKLGVSKPKAAKTRASAGAGPTRISVVMNYKDGMGVGPIKKPK
jgi:uncharacterized protein (DUF2141 family)